MAQLATPRRAGARHRVVCPIPRGHSAAKRAAFLVAERQTSVCGPVFPKRHPVAIMAQVSCTICSGELEKEVPSMRNIGIFGVSAFGQGPWRPGKKVWAVAIAGASEIDFRQAQLFTLVEVRRSG